MLTGPVARVDPDGKFGFITRPDGREYFFHQTALMGPEFGEMAPGVHVEFNTEEGGQAGDRPGEDPRAINIRLAPDADPAVDNEELPEEKVTGRPEEVLVPGPAPVASNVQR